MVLEQVALGDPPGILHTVTLIAERPELRFDEPFGIIALERLVFADIVARRKQVYGYQWIGILPLRQHVLFVYVRVHQAHVHRKFVVEVIRGIAESDVVTIEIIVGNDPSRSYRADRYIVLAALVATRQGNAVGGVEAGPEKILGIVAARGFEFIPPTEITALFRKTVGILEARHDER